MNQTIDQKNYLQNADVLSPATKKRVSYRGKEVPLPPIFRGIMNDADFAQRRKGAKEEVTTHSSFRTSTAAKGRDDVRNPIAPNVYE